MDTEGYLPERNKDGPAKYLSEVKWADMVNRMTKWCEELVVAKDAILCEFQEWRKEVEGDVTPEHVYQFQMFLFKQRIGLYNSILEGDKFTYLKQIVGEVVDLK